jgi:hypothetical protein
MSFGALYAANFFNAEPMTALCARTRTQRAINVTEPTESLFGQNIEAVQYE